MARRPSILRRLADWVFGYDFFISYAQRDGLNYPKTLKSRLESSGYKVFLDRDDYVAGDDLPSATRRRVRMSRKLIVVTRPRALVSDWVQREIDVFTERGSIPIVVDVNRSLERSRSDLAKRILGSQWLRIPETLQRRDADASDHVVLALARSFTATRQETKRLRFLGAVATSLAVLALATGIGWYFAERNKQRAISGQVELHLQNGMEAIDNGYLWAAWVWFAEALAIDHARGAPEGDHRTRIASVRKQLPELQWMWFLEKTPSEIRFLPSSRRLLVVADGIDVLEPGSARRTHLEGSDGNVLVLDAEKEDSVYTVTRKYAAGRNDAADEVASWNAGISSLQKVHVRSAGAKAIAIARGTQRVLVRSDSGLQVRAIGTDTPVWSSEWQVPGERWESAALAADGKIVVASTQSAVWSRDVSAAAKPAKLLSAQRGTRNVVDIRRNWVVVSEGDRLILWQRQRMDRAPLLLELKSHLAGFAKLLDIDFSPDDEHVVTAIEVEGGNRVSLVFQLRESSSATLVARIEHELAVERWEYNPPAPSGAGAATIAGAVAVNPFERSTRFSPDGRMLATVSRVDGFLRVWNWRAGLAVTPPLGHRGGGVRSFAFAPDAAAIAVASQDRTIRLWGIARPDGDKTPYRTKDRVDALQFTADGTRLVYEGYDPAAQVLQLSASREGLRLEGHTAAITGFALSPNQKYVATASYDKSVLVHELVTGRLAGQALHHDQAPQGVVFVGDSRLISFGGKFDGPSEACEWDFVSGALGRRKQFSEREIVGLSADPRGTRAVLRFRRSSASAMSDGERKQLNLPLLWDLATNKTTALAVRTVGDVEGAGFADGGATVWVYASGHVEEFDAATGRPLRRVQLDSPYSDLLAVSADEERLAVGKLESQVQVVERRTGKVLGPRLNHPARAKVEHASFSHDGARLLTVSDEQVRIWSVESGSLLAPPFVHDVRVNDAALDPGGRMLAISDYPRRDGRGGDPSRIHIWILGEDSGAVERIRLGAIVESGYKVDSAKGFVPLTRVELESVWSAFIESGRPSAQEERVALWRRQQGEQGDHYGAVFHRGQLAEELGRRIASNPAASALYRERAHVLIRLDRSQEALADLSSVIKLDPTSAESYAERADLLHRMQRTDDALSDLGSALVLMPADRALQAKRGKYFLEVGRPDLATRDLRQAFEIDAPSVAKGEAQWMRIREVYQLAYIALQAADRSTYEASCRRALVLLAAVADDVVAAERWNATYYAVNTCIIGAPQNLAAADWASLQASLAPFAEASAQFRQNAQWLLAAVQVCSQEYPKAVANLASMEFHPHDRILLAEIRAREGSPAEAEALLAAARQDIDQWRSAEFSSAPLLGAHWPDDIDVARLGLTRVENLLAALRSRGAGK